MGKKINLLFGIIVSIVLLQFFTNCNTDTVVIKEKKSKTSKYPIATKSEIHSKVGDTVIIIVKYNYSTGKIKRWINDNECTILSLVSKKRISYGNQDCEGCGGYDEYKFVSRKSGKCFVKIGTISMKSSDGDILSNTLKNVSKYDIYKVVII
jgi:hypothetical protein